MTMNEFLNPILVFVINGILIFGLSFTYTMIRFWRTPRRKVEASENEIISPADGNVLYVKRYERGEIPISIKKGLKANLTELTTVPILDKEAYWLVGINMTPFDVHKNCAPVDGEIVLNKHIKGEFLSLKAPDAVLRNERNTLVIKNKENDFFGIVQTSSKLVKRIDSYVKTGQNIEKGAWFGMIRFGSQVDVIIPIKYDIKVEVGQQIYAVNSIIATK